MSAFVGAGISAGVELWRLDGSTLVMLPNNRLGKFYQRNCYLLLSTSTSPDDGAFKYSIHLWNGSETNEESWSEVIQKANELHAQLHGVTAHYREMEGYESSLFLSYFKTIGIEYIPGLAPKGSTSYTSKTNLRLLLVKGKRIARVSQVPLYASSLAQASVYVMETPETVFIYSGKKAGAYEKARCAEVAKALQGSRTTVYIDDEPKNEIFWGHLGGYVDDLEISMGSAVEMSVITTSPQLYAVKGMESGNISFVEVNEQGEVVKKEMLLSDGIYIFHSGLKGLSASLVYVWIGLDVPTEQSERGFEYAIDFLRQNGMSPTSISIQKVYENSETQGFVKDFAVWHFKNPDGTGSPIPCYTPDRDYRGASPDNSQHGTSPHGALMPQVGRRFSIHGRTLDDLLVAPETINTAIPDGGDLLVWRVENFKLVTLPDKKYGHFYSGDSYVVQYRFTNSAGKQEHMIYFWLGAYSTSDDKAAAAVQAKELDEKLGGTATQLKVIEGREPLHFRTLFKGQMVVHRRGKISGYKEKAANWRSSIQCTALYQVNASTQLATFATQVPVMASSLNSADCFVLVAPASVFLWVGSAASEEEKNSAEEIANVLMYVSLETEREDQETDDFWEQIGGQMEYAHDRDPVDYRTMYSESRLFQCSSLTGESLRVEEIENYDQSDLTEDAVMLLDCFNEVYVWVGKSASENAKKLALDYAGRYVAVTTDESTSIIVVTSGAEPSLFTSHFKAWDANFFINYVNPYQSKADIEAAVLKKKADAPQRLRADTDELIPYEQLKITFFEHIPPDSKEKYIDDETFARLFDMTREDFNKLARWRRDAKKKAVGLF